MSALKLVSRTPSFSMASCDHVVAVNFFGEAENAHVDAIDEHLRACAGRSEKGLGFVFVIGHGSPIPRAPVRRRATDFFHSIQPGVKVFAPIILGTGFAVVAKRSAFGLMVSGMVGTMPFKVFGAPTEACPWLAAECAKLGIACPDAAALADDVISLGPT